MKTNLLKGGIKFGISYGSGFKPDNLLRCVAKVAAFTLFWGSISNNAEQREKEELVSASLFAGPGLRPV